ncbi:MAG: protein kinase [Gemmatimonadales bacterium]
MERELGAGGMATVYLARDLKHERDVALKVLRPELGAVLGADRFLAEIKITARLDHPHILTLIDSGTADSFLYYVLPFVRGESLRDKLNRDKQLGLDEALEITKQVASALDYAHRQGVVHRDIKPENILIQEGEAMLADFGIALAVKEAGGNRLTETGLSLGTPQYMSPEQATGDRTLDARSDVYSLGAVLYEMLAGEPPVTGPNAQAMIAKLMTERPTQLRVVRDTVPEGINAAVAKALSKVPADRFPSANAFAAELARPAGPASAGRRPRWVVPAAAGLVLVALGATAWVVMRGGTASGAFTPQLEQLTTDGNAHGAALSPDGARLAYVARDCNAQGRCTERLVVRDTGGAGSITALTGSSIGGVQWASGGRFLVATVAVGGGARRVFAVPALGGAPRFLGCCIHFVVGTSDTMLLSPFFIAAGDTVAWLRFLTVSDGLVRDSVAVRRPGFVNFGAPAPAGGRVAVASYSGLTVTMRLTDRASHVTDSLTTSSNDLSQVFWAPRSDALLWTLSPGAGASGALGALAPVVVLRRRVTPDGRFAGTTDTLLRLQPGSSIIGVNHDGTALLRQGPVDAVVYALERARTGRLDFHTRRLTSSTAGLQAALSRDGATVWLLHRGEGAGSVRRDGFMPFAGGEERPFTAPRGDMISNDWTRPASTSLLLAIRDSSSRMRLIEVAVATGQVRDVAELPARTDGVFTIPGGGYAVQDVGQHSAQIRGRPGKPDTTWAVAASAGRNTFPADVAPDMRAFVSISLNSNADTVGFARIPFDGSATSPLATIVPQGGLFFALALPDGGVEYIAGQEGATLGWFRVPPGGGAAVRLGDAPVQRAQTWAMSDDGLHAIAVQSTDRPDIYLIRNFGRLLKP